MLTQMIEKSLKRVKMSIRANNPLQPNKNFYFEIEILPGKDKSL